MTPACLLPLLLFLFSCSDMTGAPADTIGQERTPQLPNHADNSPPTLRKCLSRR